MAEVLKLTITAENRAALEAMKQFADRFKGVTATIKQASIQGSQAQSQAAKEASAAQRQAMKETADAAKALNREMAQAVRAGMRQAADEAKSAAKAQADATKRAAQEVKASEKTFSDAMKAASRQASENWNAEKQAANQATAQIKKDMAEWAQAFKSANATMEHAHSGISTNSKAFGELAQEIGKVRVALGLVKYAFAALGIAATVRGIISLGKAVLGTTEEFEGYRARLFAVLKSQSLVNQAMFALQRIAATTPFTLGEVTDGYQRMIAYGLQPTLAKMRIIGDFASAMHRSFTDAVEAVADATRGEFERMREFGVTKEMIQAMDHNILDAQGRITNYARFQEDLFKIMADRSKGAMATAMDTITGKISNLKDAITRSFERIGAAMSGPIKDALSTITRSIEKFTQSPAFDAFINNLKNLFSRQNLQTFTQEMITVALEIKKIIDTIYGPIEWMNKHVLNATGKGPDLMGYAPNRFGFKAVPITGKASPLPDINPNASIGDQTKQLNSQLWGVLPPASPFANWMGNAKKYPNSSRLDEVPSGPAQPQPFNQAQIEAAKRAAEKAKKDAQEYADFQRQTRIDAIKGDEQRELQQNKFDMQKEMRQAKDAATRVSVQEKYGRLQSEIEKKYQDQRMEAERQYNDAVSSWDDKQAKMAKDANDAVQSGLREDYDRSQDLFALKEQIAKSDKDRIPLLQEQANLALEEAIRLQQTDPQGALDAMKQRIGYLNDIAGIQQKIADQADEDAKKRQDAFDKQVEAQQDLIRKRIDLQEKERQHLEDILDLEDQLITQTLPKAAAAQRQIILDFGEVLARGADQGLAAQVAAKSLRETLGLEPPANDGEYVSKWKRFWEDVRRGLDQSFKGIGESFFEAILSGQERFKNAFKALFSDIRALAIRALANIAVEKIGDVFKGVFSGGHDASGAAQTAATILQGNKELRLAFDGIVGTLAISKRNIAASIAALADAINQAGFGGKSGTLGAIGKIGGIIGAVAGIASLFSVAQGAAIPLPTPMRSVSELVGTGGASSATTHNVSGHTYNTNVTQNNYGPIGTQADSQRNLDDIASMMKRLERTRGR